MNGRFPMSSSGFRIAAVAAALIFSVLPSMALAAGDSTIHGGIITGIRSDGNNGFVSVTVINPYSAPAYTVVVFNIYRADGSSSSQTFTITIPANGTTTWTVSNRSNPFQQAIVGASASGPNGASADGQAYSVVNGQPCGSGNQPKCPN